MFGLSISHLILLLVVVVLIFGTSKLRNMGSDLGGALRDFKKGLNGSDEQPQPKLQADAPPPASAQTSDEKKRESAQ